MTGHRQNQEPRFLPYAPDFTVLKGWRRGGIVLLVVVSALSIYSPLAHARAWFGSSGVTEGLLDFMTTLAIIGYFVVAVAADVFLYPATARKRRLNLLDNSLGSRFLGATSHGYFSNDGLPNGAHKLATNSFENCFFTYNIAKRMWPAMVGMNALFAVGFLAIAYFGIQNQVLGVPLLQVFLSSLFLTTMIHHLAFVSRLSNLLDRFKAYFMEVSEGSTDPESPVYPTYLLLEYETTLAYNKAPLSDRIYARLNVQLSEEWENLKQHYSIESRPTDAPSK